MNLEDKDWGRFLDDMGLSIQGRLRQDAGLLHALQPKARAYAEMRQAYARAVADDQRRRMGHWQKVKADPRLRVKSDEPPRKGLKWNELGCDSEDLPEIKNAKVIEYSLDGLDERFPAVGGPEYEMPARYVDRYTAALLARIVERIGETPSFRSQVEPGVWVTQMGWGTTLENMRRAIAVVEAQRPGIQDESKDWVYTSLDFHWWSYVGLDETDVFGYWRLPAAKMPPNVDDWLDRTLMSQPPDAKLATLEKDEAAIRRAVVVTGLHDRIVDRDRRISAEIWPDELFDRIINRIKTGRDYGLNETFIRSAWSEVQADLQKAWMDAGNAAAKKKARGGWKPPRGYTGAQSAGVPRSTLQEWEQKDNAPGGPLDGKTIERDPSTKEKYYPTAWLDRRKRAYKPRK